MGESFNQFLNVIVSVQCSRNPAEYFADRLWKSMKGAGTDDSTLVRVVVSRSEVSLLACFLFFCLFAFFSLPSCSALVPLGFEMKRCPLPAQIEIG